VTQNDIIQFATGLSGVVVVTASEANGAPLVAWGDSFFFYDPDADTPSDRRFPFATIVTKDYEGFDTASNLNRPDVFRLNINVGRRAFHDLIGYPPAAHSEHDVEWDYSAMDQLLPHPIYAKQAWISIVNPGEATEAHVRSLLTDAYTQAIRRHRPRP
jgi:hypothetical protein